ncbi:MAG: dipeptidase [Gemmatimonadales bacterium]
MTKSLLRILIGFSGLILLATAAQAQDDPALAHARQLLRQAPVWDGHNDLPWAIREYDKAPMDVAAYDLRTRTPGETDIARLREGQVGAQFWSVYIPGEARDSGYARMQLEQIDIARRFIARYPDVFTFCLTAACAETAMRQGKIASFLGMEGGHAIENSLGALRAYYDLGARYMTLTHNVTLDWADAAQDTAAHDGLTPFGVRVVHEMNRLGMLVDLSHVSPATMSDALNASQAPVMFSHSSARALTDVPRNVPDSILSRLPANGGIVMVTFVPGFVNQTIADSVASWSAQFERLRAQVTDDSARARLRREFMATHTMPHATIADVADHIEHVRDVAGVDHVGLGGDFDGTGGNLPDGLQDTSRYPFLFAELIRRGWSDTDLKKLANGNMLRVLKQAEEVAKRMQGETSAMP